ncbi:hypothetical protein PFISCL1PPCAC_21398, partial [Pristionchus fissidentatus]
HVPHLRTLENDDNIECVRRFAGFMKSEMDRFIHNYSFLEVNLPLCMPGESSQGGFHTRNKRIYGHSIRSDVTSIRQHPYSSVDRH